MRFGLGRSCSPKTFSICFCVISIARFRRIGCFHACQRAAKLSALPDLPLQQASREKVQRTQHKIKEILREQFLFFSIASVPVLQEKQCKFLFGWLKGFVKLRQTIIVKIQWIWTKSDRKLFVIRQLSFSPVPPQRQRPFHPN